MGRDGARARARARARLGGLGIHKFTEGYLYFRNIGTWNTKFYVSVTPVRGTIALLCSESLEALEYLSASKGVSFLYVL